MTVDIRGLDAGRPDNCPTGLPDHRAAVDRVTFPVEGSGQHPDVDQLALPISRQWIRWNDYGIGLFLKGKSELRQAASAFAEVEQLGSIRRSTEPGPGAVPRRTTESKRPRGTARASQAHRPGTSGLDHRLALGARRQRPQPVWRKPRRTSAERARGSDTRRWHMRGFDFSRDYRVINLLGQTYFRPGPTVSRTPDRPPSRERRSSEEGGRDVQKNPGDRLGKRHRALQPAAAVPGTRRRQPEGPRTRRLHARFKPDDNARDQAVGSAKATLPGGQCRVRRTGLLPAATNPEPPGCQTPKSLSIPTPDSKQTTPTNRRHRLTESGE